MNVFSRLLFSLLAGLLFVSSSSEVSAAVLPPNYSVESNRVADREAFDILSPDDETVQHMMEQIADVDPRFNNLGRYTALSYFITIDTTRPEENTDKIPGYQRNMANTYNFYIMPYLDGAPGTIRGYLQSYISGTSVWEQYTDYDDPAINVSTAEGRGVKNAFFATDAMEGRPAYVYGYTFDRDGTLSSPISLSADNPDQVRAFSINLHNPMALTNTTATQTYLVRGNLGNLPSYYRIASIDNDSLNGDGGGGSSEEGFWAGLWSLIVDFFSPVVDFFKNVTDWVISLFVPDEAFFDAYWSEWDLWMREQFGLLYQGIEIIIGMFTTLMTHIGGDRVIYLGTLFGGEAHIDYGTLERELPEVFNFLQFVLRAFTVMTLLRSATNMILGMFADREIQ